MRVFLAGATGVIGARLVPLLVAEDHAVAGMTRSSEKSDSLRAVARHERMVLYAGGVILRYGYFYGPGTLFGNSRLVPRPRVHLDEAARRTVELLHAPSGVVEIAEGKRGYQGPSAG